MSLVLLLLGIVYTLLASIIALYSGSFFILLAIYVRHRQHVPSAPSVTDDDLLSVTLQLPIYNEQHVVSRLIDAVGALDYPREKLVVQVLDDSTDATTALIAHKVAQWRARGLQIEHIRRPVRTGYKAGALAFGLTQCTTDCVGIFDADFAPTPDFLRRAMPHFNSDPALALVQTRATHFNPDTNWLTRAQVLAIDQHFAVEQVARQRGNLPMSMNGTGGIWRRTVIADAGGWTFETLTEDMDLSYRAFLRGWRFRYVVDVAVPGEVPAYLTAYKVQQARWAKGSTQCLLKHTQPLLYSDLTPLQKIMGLLHLGQYAIQPFLLLLFILTPPVLLSGLLSHLPLAPLGIAGIAPPLVLVLGQIALYRDWPRRILYLPVLTLLGTGMLLSNSYAVLDALLGHSANVFRRTPKFQFTQRATAQTRSGYQLPRDWTTLGELLLALYAIAGTALAALVLPAMLPTMLLYAVAFGWLAWWEYRPRRA